MTNTEIKSASYAGSRDELNAKLFQRDQYIDKLEAAVKDLLKAVDRTHDTKADAVSIAYFDIEFIMSEKPWKNPK